MDKTIEQLIQFIREEIGEFKKPIGPLTQIEKDLGVTGDEAIELVQKLSVKFAIDISAFDFNVYFHPEPGLFVKYGNINPLTIGDIEKSIISGKLL